MVKKTSNPHQINKVLDFDSLDYDEQNDRSPHNPHHRHLADEEI
jgi:hypothetical protein